MAAARLAEGLRTAGHQVDYIDRDSSLGDAEKPQFLQYESGVIAALNQTMAPHSDTYFSTNWPAISAEIALEKVREADVINLHWVARFLDPVAIRALAMSGKPVVWTLHDLRPITGGCHYSGSCRGYEEECRSCPLLSDRYWNICERSLQETIDCLADVSIRFVTPSRWLAAVVGSSRLFNAEKHRSEVIPNALNCEVFRPLSGAEKASVAVKYGWTNDKFLIVVGAQSFSERRKGFCEARAALRGLRDSLTPAQRERCAVVAYGEGRFELQGLRVFHTGSLSSAELAQVLACGDVYLNLTLEDNLPNTIMEAMACGVAVVATNVGGVPDMVRPKETGLLVAVGEPGVEAASRALKTLFEQPELKLRYGWNARVICENEYSLKVQAQAYETLFVELCETGGRADAVEEDAIRDGGGGIERPRSIGVLADVPGSVAALLPLAYDALEESKHGRLFRRLAIIPRWVCARIKSARWFSDSK